MASSNPTYNTNMPCNTSNLTLNVNQANKNNLQSLFSPCKSPTCQYCVGLNSAVSTCCTCASPTMIAQVSETNNTSVDSGLSETVQLMMAEARAKASQKASSPSETEQSTPSSCEEARINAANAAAAALISEGEAQLARSCEAPTMCTAAERAEIAHEVSYNASYAMNNVLGDATEASTQAAFNAAIDACNDTQAAKLAMRNAASANGKKLRRG